MAPNTVTTLQDVINEAREKAIDSAVRGAKARGEEVAPAELEKRVKEAVEKAVDDFLAEQEMH